MRTVIDTLRNPASVLSATAHITECTSTNTKLPTPKPNQMSASGSSAIAGSGLNIAVMVSRKSVPIRVLMANTVSNPASSVPVVKPISSTWIELSARLGIVPLLTSSTKARMASLNGGTSSGLSSQRP